MKVFKDRVAVVTGGASGLGRAMAMRFAREGMKVVLADIEKEALAQTEKEYSSRMWEEVVYELSASYTPHEVRAIEALFIGHKPFFSLDDIATRLRQAAPTNKSADDIFHKRGVSQLLRDLYRIGAIGNYYADENSGKQRWIFRGDQFLEESKRMGIHPAFAKRLAVVRKQRQDIGREAAS